MKLKGTHTPVQIIIFQALNLPRGYELMKCFNNTNTVYTILSNVLKIYSDLMKFLQYLSNVGTLHAILFVLN